LAKNRIEIDAMVSTVIALVVAGALFAGGTQTRAPMSRRRRRR